MKHIIYFTLVALCLASCAKDKEQVAEATGSITGTVFNSVTGNTIQGVRVSIVGPFSSEGESPNGDAPVGQFITGSDGVYLFQDIAVGGYDVSIEWHPNNSSSVADYELVIVSAGKTATLDFALSPSDGN